MDDPFTDEMYERQVEVWNCRDKTLPAPLPPTFRCVVDESGGLADDTCTCEDCQ